MKRHPTRDAWEYPIPLEYALALLDSGAELA